MKKKEKLKFSGKLNLNKETISELNEDQYGNERVKVTMFFCTPFPPFTVSVPCTVVTRRTLEWNCKPPDSYYCL